MKKSHLVIAVLVTVLFVFAIGGTWVVAQSDGVIQACVNPAGQPRIVDSEAECRDNETYLSWNIAGPQGPPGEPGPQGPPGPSGSMQPDFDSGWQSLAASCERLDYVPPHTNIVVYMDAGRFDCYDEDEGPFGDCERYDIKYSNRYFTYISEHERKWYWEVVEETSFPPPYRHLEVCGEEGDAHLYRIRVWELEE